MEQRRMRESGLYVPALGLGTYKSFNVRGDPGQARCEAVVDAALSVGATLFDSSPMYGEAESVLSSALALSGSREDVVVATKVWARTRAVGEGQIAQALSWFGHVDIYQVHNLLGLEDHLPYLERLKGEGRIRAIGVTHYLPSAIPDLLQLMQDRRVDAVQVPYNVNERAVERELLPEAERLGIGVIVMMPLATGRLLTRSPTELELAPLAPFGVSTWAQVLLKWILSDARIHTVIPATSSADHMRENAAAASPPWFGSDERMYIRRLASAL